MKTEKERAGSLFKLYFWGETAKAILTNILTVPTVITLLFASGLVDEPVSKIMDIFQNSYASFFWPFGRFFDFFKDCAVVPALVEEFFYRGPIRILVGLLVFFRKKELNWWLVSVIWLIGLVLNYQWAITHIVYKLVWIPVFAAGLAWLWLVIRTNRLWPAMFCHAAANLSIYLAIKVYQFLL